MKIKLAFLLAIPLLLILASTASAQTASVISGVAAPLAFPDHPQHAEPHDLATERPIVGGGPNTYTYAQGERPLWEFPNPEQAQPLGDIARAYRQKKLAAKKATTVLDKQGS